MNALSECYPMFPKKAVMDCGIGHHLNTNNRRLNVVVAAIATPAEADAWRAEIADSLKSLDPQDRWWRGCGVGMSSAAIFHSFCRDDLKREAGEYAKQSVPQDAADLGRCLRLLAAFPEWRLRLNEVATRYADTAWPKIAARWSELEAATPARQTEILRECQTNLSPNSETQNETVPL